MLLVQATNQDEQNGIKMKKIAKLYPNEKVKKNGSKINTSYLNATKRSSPTHRHCPELYDCVGKACMEVTVLSV